jgi:catechol 2,3-dioxygenase-like lactoylglutathione lyase family enzyme
MRHPTLHLIALDCPDPFALATFYSALTGIPVESWPGIDPADMPGIDLVHITEPALSFQRVDDYTPPTWPEGALPKQMHLDFLVDDLDEAEAFALSIGATKPTFQPGRTFRVLRDPAGHPFCLITRSEDDA